ncbi:hypothetical protein [Maricaulis salignorans]|uniref:Uncharacterized protein n=1 Tax=Maricaulis salignorans TaxID=144026 RepID=A0A1G9N7F1_9PROT|nr:hypothetical protein [Maricaulis salignorans]SDL82334.1 hypothetical protein SAMN04488568_102242 [Maricaulis salignorans]
MSVSFDYDKALENPALAFDTPEAVLSQAGLSDAQKIEILRRWLFDATEIADAEAEGMEADRPLLERRVALALESLTNGNDVEPA